MQVELLKDMVVIKPIMFILGLLLFRRKKADDGKKTDAYNDDSPAEEGSQTKCATRAAQLAARAKWRPFRPAVSIRTPQSSCVPCAGRPGRGRVSLGARWVGRRRGDWPGSTSAALCAVCTQISSRCAHQHRLPYPALLSESQMLRWPHLSYSTATPVQSLGVQQSNRILMARATSQSLLGWGTYVGGAADCVVDFLKCWAEFTQFRRVVECYHCGALWGCMPSIIMEESECS